MEYDAAPSKWRGSSMPIADRATSLLDLMDVGGLGARPLIFITHSLGGLVVKQMLQGVRTNTNVNREWKRISDHVRGIVFFSTPHNGSLAATALGRFWPARPGANIRDLTANNSQLRQLNQWFRNNIDPRQIQLLVYCETQSTRGIRVVDQGSADPGMPGVDPIPLDFDHVDVCKILSKDHRYQGVVRFIKRALEERATPPRIRSDVSLLEAAETVVARFRELDSKISVGVSSALRFRADWTAEQRDDLVEKLLALAYSEISLSKARTAISHLAEEVKARSTTSPAESLDVSTEILEACKRYLVALCPNDGVTPFPSTTALQEFLNEIVEARDAARVEAVLTVAATYLGIPEKDDLERAERALGSLRSLIEVQ
jgi:hypothetical protein